MNLEHENADTAGVKGHQRLVRGRAGPRRARREAPCVLLSRERRAPYFVNGSCRSCGACTMLGCPAISKDAETGVAAIDAALCIGCGQCRQYCAFDAIEQLSQSALKGGR